MYITPFNFLNTGCLQTNTKYNNKDITKLQQTFSRTKWNYTNYECLSICHKSPKCLGILYLVNSSSSFETHYWIYHPNKNLEESRFVNNKGKIQTNENSSKYKGKY